MATASGSKDAPVPSGNPVLSKTDEELYSVEECLKAMSLTDNFKSFVKDNIELWSTFGTMNSHLYRKKLTKLFEKAKMAPEHRVIVYFLFAVVKNKSRVMLGLDNFSESVKQMSWYDPVKSFIGGSIVEYNTMARSPDKFPGTHIPITDPGLDLLMWKLMSKKEERTIDKFFSRTTTVQLNLDPEMQALAHTGYKAYWDDVVTGTRNTVKTEEAKYNEKYYKTSAGDTYNLVTGKLKVWKPSNLRVGYTREEIVTWLNTDDL
jgi:hypothetical protein